MKYNIIVKEYSTKMEEIITASTIEKESADNLEEAKKLLFATIREHIESPDSFFKDGRFEAFINFYESDDSMIGEEIVEFREENKEALDKVEDFIGLIAKGEIPELDLSEYGDIVCDNMEDIYGDEYSGTYCEINNDSICFWNDYLKLTCNIHNMSNENQKYYFRVTAFPGFESDTKFVNQIMLVPEEN